MNLADVQKQLSVMIRTIDRKTSLTVEPSKVIERPGITVHLKRESRKSAAEISEADIVASQTDLMRRNQVRTALKRAFDNLWSQEREFASTKFERSKDDGGSYFAARQGFRGRR